MNEAPDYLKEMKSVPNILDSVTNLFVERNEEYKDNYKVVGTIYEVLFPHGIELKVKKDYERFALIVKIVDKTLRYTRNFNNRPSPDHLRDIIACAAMLAELDQ